MMEPPSMDFLPGYCIFVFRYGIMAQRQGTAIGERGFDKYGNR